MRPTQFEPQLTIWVCSKTSSSFSTGGNTAGTMMDGKAQAGTGAVILGAGALAGAAARAGTAGVVDSAMDANSKADVIAAATCKAADAVAMSGFKAAAGSGAMRRSVHKSKVVADSGAGAVRSMAGADSGAVACLLAVTSTEAAKTGLADSRRRRDPVAGAAALWQIRR